MSNGRYILDENNNPIPCDDLMAWGKWMSDGNRIIQQDTLENDTRVSTVFLGLDHSFGDGSPVLYETMIFGGKQDQYQDRYTTREEAIAGHNKALALAKE